jgi:hypothetical protein
MRKAESCAKELLGESANDESTWNTGNAVHHGNLILGRLALKSGDIEKAKEYLIAAGSTRGSPQLKSFGPNMALARELLEKGEAQVVLQYLELCSRYWKNDRGRVKEWSDEIKAGQSPDFGANLYY